MGKVAIITMVQAADMPQALASLASASRARRANDLHLVLFNDEPNEAVSDEIASASGAEVIEVDRNLGVAGGRNRLVKEARRQGAEFVASVDDDVLVPPDFIELLDQEFASLAATGCRPGILTPATLDFHAVGSALYSADELSAIADGAPVETPPTAKMRTLLRMRDKRRARDIYHMGITDWRGAYFYSGTDGDKALQRAYAVKSERSSGVEAHLRHAKLAWTWVLEGASPIPIDTAPGGVCFYPTALAEEIGGHDESFNPFGFEDADFALRARKAGYQHFCAPRSIAIHDIAARLSERPIAVLRATQGKMAGAFVRKHAESHEAAAAFAAISRRTIEQVTAAEEARRENGAALKTPPRLEALFAYFGNAIAFLLPPKVAGSTITAAGLAERIRKILAAAIPNSESMPLTERADGFELGRDGKGATAVLRILTHDAQPPKISIALRNAHIGLALLPPLLAATAGGDLRFDIDAVVQATKPDELVIERLSVHAPGVIELVGSGRFERGEALEGGAAPLRFDSIEAIIDDQGALPRVLSALSGVERLPLATFMRRLDGGTRDASLKRWLRGDIRTLKLSLAGVIDGAPGPIKAKVAFAGADGSPDNPAVAALWTEKTEAADVEEAAEDGLRSTESQSMTLKSLISRIVAEDPSVAPYPESYNPPKPLRMARRARYYSAGRGLPLTPNEAKIVGFRNRHRGERAFIIGNGPSLNLIDLTRLRHETTFGVNAIYLNQEKMGFLPTHHIVEDVFVAEDRATEINALRGPHKWYGHYLRYCLKQTPDVCWLNVACDYRNYPGFPHFSTNASRIVWVGGTVSYIALQLAFHMGFDEVILVGFDHSYAIPKEAKVEGRAITSTSDDPNHFHPGYFGKGYRWHDPRVDRMEKAYINARRAYEAASRKILNATVGGHLEVFERRDFNSLF